MLGKNVLLFFLSVLFAIASSRLFLLKAYLHISSILLYIIVQQGGQSRSIYVLLAELIPRLTTTFAIQLRTVPAVEKAPFLYTKRVAKHIMDNHRAVAIQQGKWYTRSRPRPQARRSIPLPGIWSPRNQSLLV